MASATNIQSARLPRTLHLRSLLQFNDGHPLPPLPPLPTCLSMRTLPPQHFCQPMPNKLYQLGIDYLHSQECLYDSSLKSEDWLAAYCAKIVPNFTEQILASWTHLHSMNLHQKLLSPSPTAMIPRTFIIISTAHYQLKKWIGLSLSLDTEQWLTPPLLRTIWSGSSHATNFPPQVAG